MTNYMTTLGEIVEIYDGPHATPKKTELGPYFLSISSLDSGRLDLSKSAHLDESSFKKWTKRVTPQDGDLLFSYETRLGQAALMPEDVKACLGRRMGLLRPRPDKVLPEYLLYEYLSPYFQQVISRNTIVGATVNRISLNEMPDFPIRIPPIIEQEVISSLLVSIDKKIELNNKINAELEAMAKLIYDYWFVQFDFPDTNGKPYKSSGGKMVYNEELKREIPEGWGVKALTEEMDVQYGFPFSTKLFNEDKLGSPVVRIRNILDNSISVYSTEDVDIKYQLEKGDLLVGMDGNFHLNFWDKGGCYLNQRCVRIRKRKGSAVSLIQALLQIEPYIKAREKNVSRTTVGHLSARDINDLKVLVPNSDNVVKKRSYFDLALDKIVVNRNESQKLTELRDWLLPMLMNGQVTIKDT